MRENAALYANGGNDGGYILFFGQGPDVWNFNNNKKHFYCSKHKFTDYNYYFLTDSDYFGKKQINTSQENITSNIISVNSFDDYTYHHEDLFNFFAVVLNGMVKDLMLIVLHPLVIISQMQLILQMLIFTTRLLAGQTHQVIFYLIFSEKIIKHLQLER